MRCSSKTSSPVDWLLSVGWGPLYLEGTLGSLGDAVGLKRKLAGSAVALSVGVLPLVSGTGIAAAAEQFDQSANFDHTFTDGSGQSVTCPVTFSSDLFRESTDDPFVGSSFTASTSQAPCDAFVSVTVDYLDVAGRRKNVTANSFLGDVFLRVDDVASHFVANHEVSFLDCTANCVVSFRTQPK